MTTLQVQDVSRSMEFYKRLGFSGIGWNADNTDTLQFVIAQRGNVSIGLQWLKADKIPTNTHWAVYIYVDDVEALHAEYTDEGLNPSEIRHPDYYGCDDFDVKDPDGHLIAFGQARNPEPHGPGLSENRGKG